MHTTGFTLWFTGLSGSGKSTLAARLLTHFRSAGYPVELLDGDEVRTHLSKDLGFSREDRDTNVRRIGWVAKLLSRNGVIALTAAISPYLETREEVRRSIGNFVEIFTDCPLATLAGRDVKGLYRKAMAGEIPNFTGVSDPYEPPPHPDITVRTDRETVEESLAKILTWLDARGWIRKEGACPNPP
ncbi:MAG: adenylyl-sulfate kinase [Candidatus Brocadiae bacterium]|nr:adenylyl-sulfate kinase [Candidatus Brocadiia bacterium]